MGISNLLPQVFTRLSLSVSASNPFQVTGHEVFQALKSFAPGSAGGPDGLRPQHILDIIEGEGGGSLFLSLTKFVKEGKSLIAVDLTLRRLGGKGGQFACNPAFVVHFLSPPAVGGGESGGL